MSDTRKAIRYFIKYLKPYKKGIAIVIILSLLDRKSVV